MAEGNPRGNRNKNKRDPYRGNVNNLRTSLGSIEEPVGLKLKVNKDKTLSLDKELVEQLLKVKDHLGKSGISDENSSNFDDIPATIEAVNVLRSNQEDPNSPEAKFLQKLAEDLDKVNTAYNKIIETIPTNAPPEPTPELEEEDTPPPVDLETNSGGENSELENQRTLDKMIEDVERRKNTAGINDEGNEPPIIEDPNANEDEELENPGENAPPVVIEANAGGGEDLEDNGEDPPIIEDPNANEDEEVENPEENEGERRRPIRNWLMAKAGAISRRFRGNNNEENQTVDNEDLERRATRREQEIANQEVARAIIEEQPEPLESAIARLKAETESIKSTLERGGLSAEDMATLNQEYLAKKSELDAKISELKQIKEATAEITGANKQEKKKNQPQTNENYGPFRRFFSTRWEKFRKQNKIAWGVGALAGGATTLALTAPIGPFGPYITLGLAAGSKFVARWAEQRFFDDVARKNSRELNGISERLRKITNSTINGFASGVVATSLMNLVPGGNEAMNSFNYTPTWSGDLMTIEANTIVGKFEAQVPEVANRTFSYTENLPGGGTVEREIFGLNRDGIRLSVSSNLRALWDGIFQGGSTVYSETTTVLEPIITETQKVVGDTLVKSGEVVRDAEIVK